MATISGHATSTRRALDALADFAATLRYDDIPESTRLHSRYVLMDTVGAMLGGSTEVENVALIGRLALEHGEATVMARGLPPSTSERAAQANGTSGTALEQDEGHLPVGHPAIYTVPATLAVGEEIGASGRSVIETLVVAYELSVRLARSTRFDQGLHTHGSIAAVAAAVAAGRARGFGVDRLREAIDAAACLNGATPFFSANEGATVRNAYAGLAGYVGVLVSRLVESGFTGPRDGLNEVYTRLLGHGIDAGALTDGLGEGYEITTNYFKLHAACRYTHAPLDALQAAQNGRTLAPDEVREVRVVGNANAAMCGRHDPQNSLAAKFSVPFALATAIVNGHTGVEAFRQPAVDDAVTRDLARRVVVVEEESYTARFPSEQVAEVEVRLESGDVLTGAVTNPRGAEHDPVAYAEVERKFETLSAIALGHESQGKARRLILGVHTLPDVRELTAGLRALSR